MQYDRHFQVFASVRRLSSLRGHHEDVYRAMRATGAVFVPASQRGAKPTRR